MTYMHHLLRFLLEQRVLASRGTLSLFTELPRRGLLGNWGAGVDLSRKLKNLGGARPPRWFCAKVSGLLRTRRSSEPFARALDL